MDIISDDPLVQEARRHSGRIVSAMAGLAGLIQYAWDRRYDRVLSYESWQAYCVGEFGSGEVAVKARQIVVSLLSDAGMSQRSIAEQTGVSQKTVSRDLSAGESPVTQLNDNQQPEVTQSNQPGVLGKDNKVHPRIKRPKPTPAAIGALRKEIEKRLKAGKKTDFRQLMVQYEMSQSVVQTQIQVVRALLEDRGQRPAGGRAKNWNGKTTPTRQRELKESARASESENYLRLMKMQTEIYKLCAVLERFRIEDLPLNEVSLQTITDLLDDLISLGIWHHQALASVSKWIKDSDRRRRIEALRNTEGRQPEEVKAYLAMADKLERKLITAE